jgi:phospholipid-transporting ATPase
MRNAEPGRIKQSQIEETMNKLLLGIMGLQAIMCIVSAILNSLWSKKGADHWYLEYPSDYDFNLYSFLTFFSYFLLYNTMIPISLIVSLEFVKVFQSYFMQTDEEMYVPERNKFASVQTTTINEELGQVEYIFSDKTGTLTCNKMEFKYCVIGHQLYGKNNDLVEEKQEKKEEIMPKNLASVHPDVIISSNVKSEETFQHSIFTFKDVDLEGIIQNENSLGEETVDLRIYSDDNEAFEDIGT